MNCKSCIHWRRGGSFDYKNGVFNNRQIQGEVVGLVKDPFDQTSMREIICKTSSEATFGICLSLKLRADITDSWLGRSHNHITCDSLIASDNNEERASLETGELFGCIHFSPKPL